MALPGQIDAGVLRCNETSFDSLSAFATQVNTDHVVSRPSDTTPMRKCSI
jgi:hypothetical protein